MKIVDLKIWVTRPNPNGRSYVFLRIDTNEGISGVGEATSSGGGGSIIVGNILQFLRNSTVEEDFRETLIGENPEHVFLAKKNDDFRLTFWQIVNHKKMN